MLVFSSTIAFGQHLTQQHHQPTTFVFRQTTTSTPSSGFGSPGSSATSAFGQPEQQPNIFVFGQAATSPSNTAFGTRYQCITAMREHEGKSLEELRLEDYTANRRGPLLGSIRPGLFGSTPQNTSIFMAPASQPQSTGLFGGQSTFGSTAASPFGQPRQQPPGTFVFGQTATSTSTTAFGSPGSSATSVLGQPQTTSVGGTGITIYHTIPETETVLKNGVTLEINTWKHCITAMREYEGKSLEELRLEDYAANRKGPQAGNVRPGIFGSTPQNRAATSQIQKAESNTLRKSSTSKGLLSF